jgi:hypothetical protein
MGRLPSLLLFYQLFFPFSFHVLDLDLTPHCTSPVWKFFHVHQPDRAVAAGVPGPTTRIMLPRPPLGVGRPSGVIAPVRTLEDVTEAGHQARSVLVRFLVSTAEEFIQTAYLLF